MDYKTVFKNGRIILPKEVSQELGLQEGDEVIIRIATVRNLHYAYLASVKSEVLDWL